MSVLAHPGPISFPTPRRRHLTVVPALPSGAPEPEQLADVIALPPVRTAQPRPASARPAVERPAARGAATSAPMRLTARGRVVLAGLAIVAAAITGSVVGSVVGQSEPTTAVEVITVTSGDSLWSVAAAVAAPGDDVRDVMSEIAALNELDGTTLVAGQRLTVPSEG